MAVTAGPTTERTISVTLEWRDIELNAQTPAGPKAILRGLTGHASPGELVAIMGPSGAGKTSLLNVLAHRTPGFGGQVILNGTPWRELFHSILAYMPQDEMFLAQLTPREHLTFMAALRMHGKGVSEAQQLARVEQVLREMKLTGVADSLIGMPQMDGSLSRNERKRLNFATETLTGVFALALAPRAALCISLRALNVEASPLIPPPPTPLPSFPCRRAVAAVR